MKKRKQTLVFIIDLDSKKPEVSEFSGAELEKDLKCFNVKDPLKLSDYDRKVFLTEKEAEKYLARFSSALKKLPKLTDGKWEPGPSLIYKRHYLAQTFLGEKLQTYRDYKRDWKPGQIIKLYDQTYYLLVRLKAISKTSNGFKYQFQLA